MIVGILTAIFFLHSGQLHTDAWQEEILARSVAVKDSQETTLKGALSQVLSSARVPGGIVTVAQCGEEPKYNFAPFGSSLHSSLESIIAARPDYKWVVEEGVVNVLHSGGNVPMLDSVVSEFELKESDNIFGSLNRLLSAPEVQRRAAELNLRRGSTQLGIMPLSVKPVVAANEANRKTVMSCKDITLREALNAIVREHKTAVWAYTERHCNGNDEFSIDFLVR